MRNYRQVVGDKDSGAGGCRVDMTLGRGGHVIEDSITPKSNENRKESPYQPGGR